MHPAPAETLISPTRALFNTEKDKSIKLQILKSWIDEANKLLGPIQKISPPNFVAEEAHLRKWVKVQGKITHNLPDPVEDFITSADKGKDRSYLTLLWEMLHRDGTTTLSSSAAIAGMGGIGKTSLALVYAHEALKNKAYNLIYWISSETEESLLQSCRELLREINVLHDNGTPIKSIGLQRTMCGFIYIETQAALRIWLLMYSIGVSPFNTR